VSPASTRPSSRMSCPRPPFMSSFGGSKRSSPG
jgi:hypothetical protein